MDRSYLNKEYGHLIAGSKYSIAKSFRDYDNYPYEEGNVIEFIGSNFVPYEDGLSLFCIYKLQRSRKTNKASATSWGSARNSS